MTEVYNKYKEYNDQLDEPTKKMVDALALSINDVDTVLNTSDAPSEKVTPIIESFMQQLQDAQNGWAEIEEQLGN